MTNLKVEQTVKEKKKKKNDYNKQALDVFLCSLVHGIEKEIADNKQVHQYSKKELLKLRNLKGNFAVDNISQSTSTKVANKFNYIDLN